MSRSDFYLNEPDAPIRFLEVKLAGGGTTTREGVVAMVEGGAITGPTRFPVLMPKVALGERAEWTRDGWVIRPPKRKPRP